MNYEEIRQAAFDDELNKIAYVGDFVAGLDPTGVSSFKRGLKAKRHEGVRRAAGIAGGVTNGLVIGATIPAAITGVGALVLKKKMPELSKVLKDSAVASMHALHPGKLLNYAKSLPAAFKVQGAANKFMRSAARVEKLVSGSKIKDLRPRAVGETTFGNIKHEMKRAKILSHAGARTIADKAAAEKMGKGVADKYYGGGGLTAGVGKALTALTTLGASLGGAAVGGASSALQFNEGLNQRNKLRKFKH